MKLYAERKIIQQGQAYCDHILAMTQEGLHDKSDIAAELAHRDIEIERLRAAIQQTLDENANLADGDNCTLIVLRRAMDTGQ